MHQFSDSDTSDSDDGRRFKTESIRPKKHESHRVDSRYKSPSPPRRSYGERRRRSRSRSRSRYDKDRRYNDKHLKKKDSKRVSNREEKKVKEKSKVEDLGKYKREEVRESSRKARDLSDGKAKNNETCEVFENGKETQENIQTSVCIPRVPASITDKQEKQICESYGPALPPPLPKHENIASIGPILPPKELDNAELDVTEKVIGPNLPPHLREQLAKASEATISESEDDDMIGPLPPEMCQTKAHIALEERALQIKINNLTGGGTEEMKREEWMMELPAVRSGSLGLGPRQFRANPGPDMSDRSSWTDTPEDKLRKQRGESIKELDLKKEAEIKEVKKRDEEQEEIIKKHKKHSKRAEKSLVEIHQLKMQESKESTKEVERRPFSREIDLKVNRFDEAQKKAVLKKAQLLNDRFSSGEAKYL